MGYYGIKFQTAAGSDKMYIDYAGNLESDNKSRRILTRAILEFCSAGAAAISLSSGRRRHLIFNSPPPIGLICLPDRCHCKPVTNCRGTEIDVRGSLIDTYAAGGAPIVMLGGMWSGKFFPERLVDIVATDPIITMGGQRY